MFKFIILVFFSLRIFSQEALLGTKALGEGALIPNFPIYTLDEKRSLLHDALSSLEKDKFVLLNFTSTFCQPCKYEVPELLKLNQEHPNVEVWFVFVGDENSAILKKTQELGIPSSNRILKDPLDVSLNRLGVKAVPMTYLLKNDRVISASSIGYTQEEFKSFKKRVKTVILK